MKVEDLLLVDTNGAGEELPSEVEVSNESEVEVSDASVVEVSVVAELVVEEVDKMWEDEEITTKTTTKPPTPPQNTCQHKKLSPKTTKTTKTKTKTKKNHAHAHAENYYNNLMIMHVHPNGEG